MLVHRALRYLIRSGEGGDHVTNPGKLAKLSKKQILPYQQSDMVTLGEHCSMTERRADDATRDVVQWLKCQYMQQHLGDSFSGVISAVTSFGIFVQISDLYIEGLVHISALDADYYHYDAVRHALVGESSQRKFRLGDTVQVQVAAVHIDDRKIDLVLAPEAGATNARPGSVRKAVASGKFPGKKGGEKGGGRAPAAAKPADGKPAADGKGPPRGRKSRRRRK